MERLTRWMLRHPRKILVAFFLLTLFFGLEIRNLRIDPSVEIFIPEGHPEVVFFREMREVFGLFNFIMVGVVDEREGGIFQPEPLRLVMDLSSALGRMETAKDCLMRSSILDPSLSPFAFALQPGMIRGGEARGTWCCARSGRGLRRATL